MDLGNETQLCPPVLPLDTAIPHYALKRRFGISFSSSSCYLTHPRFERRGGISFERTDRNAIYIRMLGDVKLRGNPDKLTTDHSAMTLDAEKKMLDKLVLPDQRHRFRSRFMSVNKTRRQRKCHAKFTSQGGVLVDEFYNSPAQLSLSHISDWSFNIFSLDTLAGGRSLFYIANHLFQTYDLIKGFHLDTVRLLQFFTLIEENYHESNPYHNALHAADVAQSMHCYLQERELFESTSNLEKMAALVAALTHDLDHPGVNNAFLTATSNHLATLYKNISVLENHHWRSAVGLLQETGVLSHLPLHLWESFIQQVKSLILATDITRQQEFLLKFSRYIESGEFQYRRNQEHRHFMLQIALKCADISNPCRPWKISKKWSKRVCDEFFLQGDTERALNMAVTPICDRVENTVANIQHGFMQFVVNPLFKAWDRFLVTDLSKTMLDHLAHNQGKWKDIMDKTEELSETSVDNLQSDQLSSAADSVKIREQMVKMEECESHSSADEEKREDDNDNEVDMEVVQRVRDMYEVHLKEEQMSEHEEEEEDKHDEEDDIVSNDVNLLYHYSTDSSEHLGEAGGRCLSPVSEDIEQNLCGYGNGRRYSMPHVIRKDLNFYLGLRRENSGFRNPFSRRQSLPVTAMRFQSVTSSENIPISDDSKSPRSLSMDTLLTRPKISNLSPNMDASFISGCIDPLIFTPLENQTLMLQEGSLTRFTSNATSRQSSSELLSTGVSRNENNNLNVVSPDLIIPPYKHWKPAHPSSSPQIGLASSWPSVAHRKTTNGSISHNTSSSHSQHPISFNKSVISRTTGDFTCIPPYVSSVIPSVNESSSSNPTVHDSDSGDPHGSSEATEQMLTSAALIGGDNSSSHVPRCLSISSSVAGQDDHSLTRPQ